jgi:nitrogen fixation NifU-like protein
MIYSKKVLQHFLHPKFFGKIKNADGMGRTGNPLCGDVMELYLKIDEKSQKIKDIKFHTTGCAAAIASSDMVCQFVKGKTIKEALKVDFKDILKKLGNLPPVKVHCSILAIQALRAAIDDYRAKAER